MDDRDRKRFFGQGKDVADTLGRLEATLSKVIQESYVESNCSMTDCYKLADKSWTLIDGSTMWRRIG